MSLAIIGLDAGASERDSSALLNLCSMRVLGTSINAVSGDPWPLEERLVFGAWL